MEEAKILLVEDEAITAMVMKNKLSRMGYRACKMVSSGEDAIENVEQEKPDVILMDIILSGKINGIDAAIEIRSRYDIPVIFTTGCDDESTKELAMDVKPVAYLVKPVILKDLKLAIEKALSSK